MLGMLKKYCLLEPPKPDLTLTIFCEIQSPVQYMFFRLQTSRLWYYLIVFILVLVVWLHVCIFTC